MINTFYNKSWSAGLVKVTFTNNTATTSIPAFTFVKLTTTPGTVTAIATKGQVPFGITQEIIKPLMPGAIAVRGISRLKMCGTAYTTAPQVTTPIQVGANASGCGKKLTTSTLWVKAIALTKYAASEIIAVELGDARRFNN